ncbi:unnamed protein product [Eruca vesicaria subsp. sativa]|uniref:Uncharacterized protein n=1 Tax=Eruca vesicaria subsp. sativa TaxID=29727 RepID=A0ABC8M3E7_ERUVS|nr:unnamed protein product [Eruca vesicaria subsp. sativa]
MVLLGHAFLRLTDSKLSSILKISSGCQIDDHAPYDRRRDQSWREKQKDKKDDSVARGKVDHRSSGAIVPYEQSRYTSEKVPERSTPPKHDDSYDQKGEGSETIRHEGRKKVASTIISPALRIQSMEENVTIRSKSITRSLTFSPRPAKNDAQDAQVIEALSGMDHQAAENEVQLMDEDDLLSEEL